MLKTHNDADVDNDEDDDEHDDEQYDDDDNSMVLIDIDDDYWALYIYIFIYITSVPKRFGKLRVDVDTTVLLSATLAWLPIQKEQPGISVLAPTLPYVL